jgi:hypothetical protein
MGRVPIHAMFISVLVLPALLVISRTPYCAFPGYFRNPVFNCVGVAALVWSLAGGSWGFLGMILLIPYQQAGVMALFALIHRRATGRELEITAFTPAYHTGKYGLALLDRLANIVMLGLPCAMIFAYIAFRTLVAPA